ncbi:MAG: hypothetical protein ACXAC2_17285 [Candidatus Kariarchaeaceae archaeon]|jgi:hypothetical protein
MTYIGTNFSKNYKLTIGGVLSLLTGTSVYYLSTDELTFGDYILILASIAVAIATLIVVVPLKRDYDKGLPVTDEFSQNSSYRAGYYSWITTLWIVVAVMLFDDLLIRVLNLEELAIEHLGGIIVFSSVITFLVLSQYFFKRGRMD